MCSGVGKSSLINSILGETSLLPTGACTASIVELGYQEDGTYTAEVAFIVKHEWEEEVDAFTRGVRCFECLFLLVWAYKDYHNKPVWPTWAVGALFRGARRIHINRV
jgi:hypothetical protein